MAEAKKPAVRKSAKRGPTKQASLKALGLTQDDLDLIKDLKAKIEESGAILIATPEQAEPTSNPAYENVAASEATSTEEPTFYARNLRNMEFRMRLNRQKENVAPVPLKPRGQRGDMIKLEKSDLSDEHLIANVELDCIEIITAAEAARAIQGQLTNAQTAVHPAMAMLRNELGQEYAPGAVKGAEEYVDNSVVVAELNPVAGEYGEIQFDRQRGSIARTTQAAGQAAESGRTLGGNPALISDGFAAQRAADKHARRKDLQGPAAGLPAGTQVRLDTPKKVVPPKPKGS